MPYRIVQTPPPGVYRVRAYCTKCKTLLQESNPLTQKQLIANWQDTVLNALQFRCEKCGHKIPNVYIELRIYDSRFNTEVLPENCSFLKISAEEGKQSYNKFVAKMAEQAKQKYKESVEDADEAIDQAMRESAPISVDILEDGSAVLPVEDIDAAIKEEVKKRRSDAKRRTDNSGANASVQTDLSIH